MFIYDSNLVYELVKNCKRANTELNEAYNLLTQIQTHRDWYCKEKKTIDSNIQTCKKELLQIVADQGSMLYVMTFVGGEFERAQYRINNQFDSVDDHLRKMLELPVKNNKVRGQNLLNAVGKNVSMVSKNLSVVSFQNIILLGR